MNPASNNMSALRRGFFPKWPSDESVDISDLDYSLVLDPKADGLAIWFQDS